MEPSDQAPPEDQPDAVDIQLTYLARDIERATTELGDVIEAARQRAARLDRLGRKPDPRLGS